MAIIQSGAGATSLTVDPTSTAARATLYDASGNVITGQRATYRLVMKAITPVGSATAPFFALQGSNTKTVMILRVRYSATAATGIAGDIWGAKFGTLTGGTIAGTPTIAAMDSADPAASAVASLYTAVATTATLVDGFAFADRYETVTAAVSVSPAVSEHIFSLDDWARGLTLHGTTQYFGLGISAAGTTPVADAFVEWIEY